jgi:hypothetical protein
MRCHLSLLCLAAAAFSAPADAAIRNFGIAGFDRIRIDGPFKVQLTTGIAPFARASGSPSAIDRVAVELQGRTLIVRPERSSWGGYPGDSTGPVEIAIGTHELTSAWVNGAGSLAITRIEGLSFDLSVQGPGLISVGQADVDQLRIGVAGTGAATIAGRTGKLTATVRGLSSLDAAKLVAKDARIGAEGPASVKAHVTNEAVLDGTGVATIALAGEPACTTKTSGSATVSGCR